MNLCFNKLSFVSLYEEMFWDRLFILFLADQSSIFLVPTSPLFFIYPLTLLNPNIVNL